MLAGAVDAGERLLVQQADQAVLVGRAAHDLHRQHLVIGGQVRVLEDRRDFVLARRDFVVPGLDRHAELEQLRLGVGHAGQHALGDGAEVLVFQFLALGRLGAEERAAGVDEVGPGVEEVLVDEEVFLLGADGGEDLLDARCCRTACRMRRAWVDRASIERSSGVFLSRASPVQLRKAVGMTRVAPLGPSHDEGGAGRVPGGVAAGLEGGADAAARGRSWRRARRGRVPCR